MSNPTRYKLIFTVPLPALELCKAAVFASGAGAYPGGRYVEACLELPGTEQFIPTEGAKPSLGTVGELERVEVMRVEVMCVGEDVMREAVRRLKAAHPYEEPAYEVYRMEDVE